MRRTLIAACCVFLCVATLQAAGRDPSVGFRFTLESQGTPLGVFRSVDGLTSENEVIEFRSAGDDTVMKLPGRLKYGDITLKRGISSDTSLAAWRAQVENGQIQQARKNGSIVLFDQAGREVARWNFTNGWPSKISLETDPVSGDLLEVLVLAVESIRRP